MNRVLLIIGVVCGIGDLALTLVVFSKGLSTLQSSAFPIAFFLVLAIILVEEGFRRD